MFTRLLLPLVLLIVLENQRQSSATPIVAEPPKEVSTNGAASPLVDPSVPKESGVFSMPLTARRTSYRRGPMTHQAVYDPVRNITHIWDINRGSYDLPGDHTKPRKNRGGRRQSYDNEYYD